MSRRLTLVLGGIRAGKSRYAQELAGEGGRVLYVATAEAGDEEMAARIAAHRAERPRGWATLEEPVDLVTALTPLVPDFDTVLIDCLTLWVSNLLLQDPDRPGDAGTHPDAGPSPDRPLRAERCFLDCRQQRGRAWRDSGNQAGPRLCR